MRHRLSKLNIYKLCKVLISLLIASTLSNYNIKDDILRTRQLCNVMTYLLINYSITVCVYRYFCYY